MGGASNQSASSTTVSTGGTVSTTNSASTGTQNQGGTANGSTSGVESTGGSAGADGTNGDVGPTYVYVGSGDFSVEPGMITVYSLDRSTQSLTFVSEYPTGALALFLVVDPERARLFSIEPGGAVQSFSIDRETGELTSRGTTAIDSAPTFATLTPDGQYLLGANATDGTVQVFSINGEGKVEGLSDEIGAGQTAWSVVTYDQNRVFVAQAGPDLIGSYVFQDGSFTPGGPSVTFDSPGNLVVASDKLYAISRDADVVSAFWAFDGQLVLDWELPRLGSSTGDGADIEVTPSGKYLYATNLDPENSIAMYDISGVEPIALGHESSRGSGPFSLAIDPGEELVIVGNLGDPPGLELFSIQADGSLEHAGSVATSLTPFHVIAVEL